ncbi:MAG: hypothetical protein DRN04_12910 [Thermoprotei archaeon]|nr:MAG: hypothetical protein DRN04_12910 [Thermoprotei archaeon]
MNRKDILKILFKSILLAAIITMFSITAIKVFAQEYRDYDSDIAGPYPNYYVKAEVWGYYTDDIPYYGYEEAKGSSYINVLGVLYYGPLHVVLRTDSGVAAEGYTTGNSLRLSASQESITAVCICERTFEIITRNGIYYEHYQAYAGVQRTYGYSKALKGSINVKKP